MSGWQAVAEVVTTARDSYHVVEALGFTGVMSIGWKLVRLFHDTKVETTKRFADVRGDIRVLRETVENHVGRTPTLADCADHVGDLQAAVTEGSRSLREEVAVLMLEHGHDVRALEDRVVGLALVCAKRHGQNGVIP